MFEHLFQNRLILIFLMSPPLLYELMRKPLYRTQVTQDIPMCIN